MSIGQRCLTNDILHIVFRDLLFDPDHLQHPDYTTLSRCSLVSRSWRAPAQAMLFHHVVLKSNLSAVPVATLFSPFSSTNFPRYYQSLLHCIRVFEVSLAPRNPFLYAGTYAHAPKNSMILLIEGMPQLYEVRVNISEGLVALKEDTIKGLNRINCKSLRALQITIRQLDSSTANCMIPFQLLHIQSWNLQFITFRGDKWSYDTFHKYSPISHRFYEVRWDVSPTPSIETLDSFISYLTSNSASTLEVLRIPMHLPMLNVFAPRLHSLCIPQDMRLPMQFTDILHATNLSELLLLHSYPSLRAAVPLLRCLQDLKRLQHLAICSKVNVIGIGDTLDILSIFMPEVPRSLDRLSLVLVGAGDQKLRSKKLIEQEMNSRRLARACALPPGQLCLGIYTSAADFKYIFWSDLVKITRWPRGISACNIPAMNSVAVGEPLTSIDMTYSHNDNRKPDGNKFKNWLFGRKDVRN